MANNYVNSSTIGVNLQGISDGSTALFGLGQHVLGNNGSEWIYAQAAGVVTTGQIVAISTAYTAKLALASDLIASATNGAGGPGGQQLAFAQGSFAASDYGWFCIRGANMLIALSNVSTLAAALYVSVNSGYITTAAGSGTLAGVLLTTCSASGVAAVMQGYLQWPRLGGGAAIGA